MISWAPICGNSFYFITTGSSMPPDSSSYVSFYINLILDGGDYADNRGVTISASGLKIQTLVHYNSVFVS